MIYILLTKFKLCFTKLDSLEIVWQLRAIQPERLKEHNMGHISKLPESFICVALQIDWRPMKATIVCV